ncbi:MAG: hypothetical protein LBT34_01775 [Clostridiales Family XIII bacterium]|jgi:hypothetical protein|nr:hypothetical protein [Clostridiales Family XIII bacterium]
MRKELTKFLVTALISLMIPALVAGCGRVDSEKIQEEFASLLLEAPSGKSVKTVEEFLLRNMTYLNEEQAGEMLTEFENYASAFDEDYFDYAEIIETYGEYISPALREIYECRELEQETPMAVDAVPLISWEELADRALAVESVIREYPDDVTAKADALWLYGGYINGMLMGMNGPPVFDYASRRFNPEAMRVYDEFVAANSGSTAAWVVSEYRKYLEGVDGELFYENSDDNEVKAGFSEFCAWLVSEAQSRVYEKRENGS